MTKKSFATYFGLVALALSLLASTAFASTATSINVKDVDAAARKPFQWESSAVIPAYQSKALAATTVPANQRLVIEQASGWCQGMLGTVSLHEFQQGVVDQLQWLPADFANGNILPASASVRFYVDPGAAFEFLLTSFSNSDYTCYVSASGYYVNLP